MKILLHDYHGTPHHFALSKELAQRGYKVYHFYNAEEGGPKADFSVDQSSNLFVFGIRDIRVKKDSLFKRYSQENKYGNEIKRLLLKYRPDILITANTPTDADYKLLSSAKSLHIPIIFWLKDLRGKAAHSILSKKYKILGEIIGRYYLRKERSLLKYSDHIVSLTEDFLKDLNSWGIWNNVSVIPDWTPIKDFPVLPKDNAFSIGHNIHQSFNIIYSGTLGFKHRPELIWELAQKLKVHDDIKLVVISEGFGADFLREKQKASGNKTLVILPFQEYNKLPMALASADVLLVTLEKDAGEYCVPSKVWTGFCTARPSLLVVPPNNLAARVTKKINAGFVVDDSVENIVEKILQLKRNKLLREEMGRNARAYAEAHFRIDKIADEFETIIEKVLNGKK